MATLTYPLALAAAILLTGCTHGRQSDCPASPQISGEIERTVHAFFDALRKEDKVAFQRNRADLTLPLRAAAQLYQSLRRRLSKRLRERWESFSDSGEQAHAVE